jgi:hypothetical protein
MPRVAGFWVLLGMSLGGLLAAETPPPTLPPLAPTSGAGAQWEVSLEPSFGLDTEQATLVEGSGDAPTVTALTLRRQFATTTLTLRRNPTAHRSYAVSAPIIWREETQEGGEARRVRSATGLGDVQLTGHRVLPRLRRSSWDGTVEVGLQLPTGTNAFRGLAPDELPLGTGHVELTGILGAQKLADPMLVSVGVGLTHTVPRSLAGTRIAPEFGYLIQSEFGYALNDRWIFSERLTFSRRSDVYLISPGETSEEKNDEAYVTHSLLYNPPNQQGLFYLAFSVGLNDTSLDALAHVLWQWHL